MYIEIIVSAAVGVVLGGVIGFLLARGGKAALAAKVEMLQTSLAASEKSHAEAVAVLEGKHKEAVAVLEGKHKEAVAALEKSRSEAVEALEGKHKEAIAALEKSHREAAEAMQARFDETMQKVSAQMKSATDDMLKQRQKEFAESNSASLGQIVNPLRETIDKMKKAMDESTLSQTRLGSEIRVTAENMIRQSEAAKKSADELTRVFRHGTKVQGDWGETVLTELLESQGMTPGIHYDVQPTMRDAGGKVIKTEAGNMLRPDVILHLDTKRDVIIDAKVSLSAFMDYVNAENEEDRQIALKSHIESLEKHVKELSVKDYSSYVQPPKVRMDYVIMFVPHSGALWTALNVRPDLWRKAMDRNVFIADEQTLFAALRIINLTWIQIAQAQNHEKVFDLANEMLDRVGQFMKKYQDLGKALEKARESYDDAGKKLSPSGQSILQTCGKLQKLGARQSDRNPLPQLADTEGIPGAEAS